MTTVLFPMGIASGAVAMSLETVTNLAPQASALMRQDFPALALHQLLLGHGIRVQEQGQAVRELAIGFSLFQAFDGYRRYLSGELLPIDSPLEIERIESIAHEVVAKGLDLVVGEAHEHIIGNRDLSGDALWAAFDQLITACDEFVDYAGYNQSFESAPSLLLQRFGQDDRVSDLLDRFAAAMRKIKEPSGRVLAQKGFASVLLESGRTDRALAVLEEALISARENENDGERCDDLEDIAYSFEKAGHHDRAEEIFEECSKIFLIEFFAAGERGALAELIGLALGANPMDHVEEEREDDSEDPSTITPRNKQPR